MKKNTVYEILFGFEIIFFKILLFIYNLGSILFRFKVILRTTFLKHSPHIYIGQTVG